MAARGRLSFHVKQQLVWFSHLSSKDSTLGRVGQVFAATSCSGQLGLGISIIRWVNGVARGVGGQAEWQHQQQQLRFLSTREGFTGLSSAERRRNSFMCSSSGERDDNSYAGTAETFRGRGRGRGRGGGGRGRGSFRPFSDRPLKEIDNGDGQKSFYSSDGGERGNSHSSSSGRNVGNPRGRGRGRGRGRDRGGFEAAWGGRVASRPSFNGSSEEFGVDDLEKRLYFSDGGEREQFGSSSDEKYRESFRGTGRGRGRGEIGNGASKDRYHSSGGQGDRESFRGRGTRGRGGRGPSFDDRLRKGASRSPSPFYRDSNSNSGTVERWKPAQGTREEKGSYSSSRGCRGSRGRAGSFRGGRPSSQFGDNIFGEDDRIPDSRLNALKSPRLRQLFEGEEKWQRKVREKKAKTGFLQDNELGPDDDPEERGRGYQDVNEDGQDESEEGAKDVEDWRPKKIGWLCREIPALRPTAIVTLLNSQRAWIKAVDTKEVIETLMRRGEILRAHRVLKWTMQQPWYENDFDLNTKMANMLGTNGKLTRMRELFDIIIATGQIPDISTYVILVKAYIADESGESLEQAFAMYNQMEQLGGYQQPAALAYALFQAFTDRKGGAHLRNLHKADALLESMRKKGDVWCMGLPSNQWSGIFTGLIHMHSIQGNVERVHELVAAMKDAAFPLSRDCYSALIRVCAKDRNTTEAERVFEDLLAAGHEPDWRAYAALIETYGSAGLPEKVQSTFNEMVEKGIQITVNVHQAVIEAMVKAESKEGALSALEKAEENFSAVLHNSYNLLMEWYKSKDMLLEVQEIFNRMKGKKCRPNLQAYNNLIDSHILRGQLDEAEAIFEDMKKLEGFHPNLKTFCLMIEAFFRAERYEKVKDCYTYLTARKMMPPEEIMVKVAGVLGKTNVADQANGKVKRKLVSEQREILVGVLLGGAKITSHDNNRTYEVGFELTDATEAGPVLIDHLYDIFADWAQQAPRTEVNDDSRKTYRFSTVSHGSLRFYAHQYRPEGLPVIPRLIHRWLNPLSLAYWYMYGGEKCKETGGIVLNACQYTSKELTLVVKALKARTVDCVIRRRKAGNVICFKDESAVWIWKLMEPHILEGLKESLRPETPVRMNGNIVKNEPEANDGELVLKTTDEADLGIESNDTETDIDVPLKVGS